MKLGNKVKDQMACPSCFFKHPLSWMAALAPLPIFACLLGQEFLSIVLTSTVLIISTVFLTFSKQNQQLVGKSAKEKAIISFDQNSSSQTQMEDTLSKVKQHEVETETEAESINQKNEPQEGRSMDQIDEHLVRSPVTISESDCLDRSSTSEDSEGDWLFRDNMYQSPDCSDGSISDEESLIEIALPSGHYVGDDKEGKPRYNLPQKLQDFSPGSFFQQHSVMELLAEINDVNEEENLIEIDISMGSIKCPRFEIEA